MAHKVFRYLIPIYIVWFIGHIFYFIYFILSNIQKGAPTISSWGLLILSHLLVIFLGIAFWIYMIIDCALRKFKTEEQKIIWLIVVCLLGFLGAIVYYYVHGKDPRPK